MTFFTLNVRFCRQDKDLSSFVKREDGAASRVKGAGTTWPRWLLTNLTLPFENSVV
jgi:hypothetical protein